MTCGRLAGIVAVRFGSMLGLGPAGVDRQCSRCLCRLFVFGKGGRGWVSGVWCVVIGL